MFKKKEGGGEGGHRLFGECKKNAEWVVGIVGHL